MRRPVLKATLVLLSVGGLLTLGMSPALADDSHGDRHQHEIQQTVHVVGNGTTVALDHQTIQSGSIRFVESTTNPTTPDGGGGSQISLFHPKHGVSLSQFRRDLADEFSSNPKIAARGTRELVRDVWVVGLADVQKGTPAVVTEFVTPGTWYLMDLANSMVPHLTTLTVRPAGKNIEQDSDLHSQVTVRATSADRFIAPRVWPDEGTYTFKNVSDTLHFMAMTPVKKGTTDAQIQAFFDGPQNAPPSFLVNGPSVGNDVVSPGGSLQLTYDLPAGTYVLLCFVADDVTGMPHAFMGMHKVIVLH
jgi:hypothetical protein